MAAYVSTYIQGGESWGGYLSVDGEKAIAIQNDMTYELCPGTHRFTIYTTSNIERGTAKFQRG